MSYILKKYLSKKIRIKIHKNRPLNHLSKSYTICKCNVMGNNQIYVKLFLNYLNLIRKVKVNFSQHFSVFKKNLFIKILVLKC